MRIKHKTPTLTMVLAALLAVVGVLMCVRPAMAEVLGVSGADFFLDDGKAQVDVLTVTGREGETVYINIERGGNNPVPLASHLAFTLTDEVGERDANGDVVGVVSVDFAAGAFDPNDAYAIEVFSDREQKDQRYAGTITTLFAKYGDGQPEPLVVRTLAKDESRPLDVPKTQTRDGVTYELASDEPKGVDGKTVYEYKASGDVADSAEAHVSYYAKGADEPIKVDSVTLAKGESMQVEVPPVVSDANGSLYRTLQLANAVTLAHPGVTERSVMCTPLSSEWGTVESFYEATIKYVGTNGEALGVVDSVVVNKAYTYTAPTYLYVDDSGTVREYKIKDATSATLRLEPGQAQGKAEFEIEYAPVADDAERTWTVVLENGSVSPKDSNRVIDRITYKGKPGESVTHKTEQKISVDGVDYVPTNTAKETYEHSFGVADMGVEQTIYYVPDGYVAPEPYDVTVKYVNIASNEVIDEQTYTASPDMRADLEISSPESFSQGGIEWVRLNGQEGAIRHSYYSAAREYVVYYRDINDDLHATTVIRNLRVVYVDEQGNTVTRPTTVVDGGTAAGGTTEAGTDAEGSGVAAGGAVQTGADVEGGGTTAAGGATAAGAATATDTGLPTGTGLRSVQGDDGAAVVSEDGNDLATTRIEDDETPLAGPQSEEAAGKASFPVVAAVAGGAGAVAAAGLVLFFVYKRRKKGESDSSNGDATE